MTYSYTNGFYVKVGCIFLLLVTGDVKIKIIIKKDNKSRLKFLPIAYIHSSRFRLVQVKETKIK